MHDHGRSSPARLLAPLALVVFALAVVLVIVASSGGGDGSGGRDTARNGSSGTGTSSTDTTPRPTRAAYTVKTGDTLLSIAEKTGVSVERLQTLNPELDPRALLSGQKIKLRE